MRLSLPTAGGLLFVACALLSYSLRADGPAPTTAKVDFNRDIRPILSDNCFACHGPDPKSRRGDLRLDAKDATHESSGVIKPGKAAESEMVKRLLLPDSDKHAMPPKKFGKRLTAEQVKLVRAWIDQGAKYEAHWAYVAPKRPALPKVRDAKWGRNPVDAFVLARLEAEGLSPSAEADKVTLIRRVTFDLTGLPPTPKDVDAFVADTSADAYEKVVDRLLKSPHHGEHMARYWLDMARFGDTHGLHLDNYREMWPYRDWVVKAFNDNVSYDKFVTAQLAGDLLPKSTLDDLVATGFNRAHVTTSEGGSITEEIHIRNVNDRVETTGTVFLGLTVGCARCHDHKYDPIAMKDFYALSAFFNSLEGSPLDGNATQHPPVVRVPMAEQAARLAAVEKRLGDLRSQMAAKSASIVYDDKLDIGQDDKPKRGEFVWVDDAVPANVKFDATNAGPEPGFVKDQAKSGALSLRVASGGGMGQRFFTEAKPGLKVGAGDKLFAHVYLDPKNPPKQVMLQWFSNNWLHRAYWGGNHIDFGRDNSTERRGMGVLPEKGKWVRLEVDAAHVGIKPGTSVVGMAFTVFDGTAYFDAAGLVTEVPQSGGQYPTLTDWLRAMKALKSPGLPADIKKLVETPAAKRTPEQAKALKAYFVQNAWSGTTPLLAPLRKDIAAAEAEKATIEKETPSTYIFRDAPTPRQAYMLKRGEYDQRGEKVERAVPGFLPPLPEKAPRTRLELAKWLLTPEHPLTSRVAVNRFWQQVFGTGLVKTSEDFGIQGEAPSHPELLDWLAVEFREKGWDVRALMRLLVTSSAYRQSSKVTPGSMAKDPANRLLSRGPRYRLDAEMLRDQAMMVSGLLNTKMGGPSVKPPQPADLWKAVAFVGSNTMTFVADKGSDKVHRRSIYTFWKRTSPPPQMTTFDAPSREACVVRRERTNTPLQALLLLNEPQYIECSRALAERVLTEGGKTADERLSFLYRVATGRKPDARESKELAAALADLLAEYGKDKAGAAKLVNTGDTKPKAGLDVGELAAWTMVCSVVLNLDEVLNRN